MATFTKVSRFICAAELLGRTIHVLPLENLAAVGHQIDGVLGNDILGLRQNYQGRRKISFCIGEFPLGP